jgi:hypothetical protein
MSDEAVPLDNAKAENIMKALKVKVGLSDDVRNLRDIAEHLPRSWRSTINADTIQRSAI